jgi:Holliday junction resolvase
MPRRKGGAGERELAHLLADELGADVRRRCRQHPGDSDVLGVDGWAIECKRVRAASRGDLSAWWAQAVAQAQASGELPMLAYRADRAPWRVLWPALALMGGSRTAEWLAFNWTCESSVGVWASVVREQQAPREREAVEVAQ